MFLLIVKMRGQPYAVMTTGTCELLEAEWLKIVCEPECDSGSFVVHFDRANVGEGSEMAVRFHGDQTIIMSTKCRPIDHEILVGTGKEDKGFVLHRIPPSMCSLRGQH